MIAVQLNKRDFEYDIHSLIRAFYPGMDVPVYQEDESEPEGWDEKLIVNYQPDQIALTYIDANGNEIAKTQRSVDYDADRKATKNVLKSMLYEMMRDITGQEITGWLCVLGAAPFAACGFFKYHGMTAEQFLWAVIKSELLYPKKLVFQSEDIYYSCMQETISLGEKNQKDGAEIIKEREQKAEAKQRKKRKGRSDAFD